MSVSARYRPDPLFAELGPEFADPVAPARARFEGGEREDLSILFPPSGAEVLVLDYGNDARGLSLSAEQAMPAAAINNVRQAVRRRSPVRSE